MNHEYHLTQFSPLGGCGCKLAPDMLDFILAGSRPFRELADGVGGYVNNEDCAFFPIGDGDTVLLSTVDFFSPVVDDAFIFGQIAAANALSDVYAKGGNPISALALLAWPIDKIPREVARLAIEGLRSKCDEACIPLLGGHSITNGSPLLGLSVNGMVQRAFLKRNSTAQDGDRLFLTKPLGSGVHSTALKMGELQSAGYDELVAVTTRLNSLGSVVASQAGLHASTDVTGFGLLGHLLEMCRPSGLVATLEGNRIPTMSLTQTLFSLGIETSGGKNNRRVFEHGLECANLLWRQVLADPQTNGGLLFAVAPDEAADFASMVARLRPDEPIYEIGGLSLTDGTPGVCVN